MTLLQLQRRMSAAVMRPLTRTGSITPTMPNGKSMRIEAREYIKPTIASLQRQGWRFTTGSTGFESSTRCMRIFPGSAWSSGNGRSTGW